MYVHTPLLIECGLVMLHYMLVYCVLNYRGLPSEVYLPEVETDGAKVLEEVEGIVTIVKDFTSAKGFLFVCTAEHGSFDSKTSSR